MYLSPTTFKLNKSASCRLQNVVAQSREYFYFFEQNLYRLCVLPAQGKLVLQQVT